MWILLAVCSAVCAGFTSIVAKCGLRGIDSTVATAFRTVVASLFAWTIVAISGSWSGILSIDLRSWIFLMASGFATGATWLCYFNALQLGEVNKVASVNKFSIVLAVILAVAFLGESISAAGIFGVALILAGTLLMIEKQDVETSSAEGSRWLLYALGSAVFGAATALLGKVGIEDVDPNLGTAVRTVTILAMSWAIVFASGTRKEMGGIDRRSMTFIAMSGLTTGSAWLFLFGALQTGPASVIVPISKLGVVVTVIFSLIVFKEALTKRRAAGIACIVAGTALMALQ